MKITWIGHSCFKLESDGYTIITDPYADGSVPGLKPVRESADLVLCSHEHGDHNARNLIKVRKGKTCPFTVETIETWHDEVKGAKRGPNKIHIIRDGKVSIAHLGDLGCEPDKSQIEKMKNLDVCLIPVGGFYTIDGKQAAQLIRMIQPKLVIPMHYRDKKAGFGYDVISTVQEFTDHMDSVFVTEESSISTDQMPKYQVVVLAPEGCKK